MITKRNIPHGKLSLEGINDKTLRVAVMKINENIVSLALQLGEIQTELVGVKRENLSVKLAALRIEFDAHIAV